MTKLPIDKIKGIKGTQVARWLILNPATGERWRMVSSSWRFACHTLNLDPERMIVVHEGYGDYTPVIMRYAPGEPFEVPAAVARAEPGKEPGYEQDTLNTFLGA
jgi:hypothetical protein